jgi:hypothetical protein
MCLEGIAVPGTLPSRGNKQKTTSASFLGLCEAGQLLDRRGQLPWFANSLLCQQQTGVTYPLEVTHAP